MGATALEISQSELKGVVQKYARSVGLYFESCPLFQDAARVRNSERHCPKVTFAVHKNFDDINEEEIQARDHQITTRKTGLIHQATVSLRKTMKLSVASPPPPPPPPPSMVWLKPGDVTRGIPSFPRVLPGAGPFFFPGGDTGCSCQKVGVRFGPIWKTRMGLCFLELVPSSGWFRGKPTGTQAMGPRALTQLAK